MQKQLVFAAVAGFMLVSAAQPSHTIPWEEDKVVETGYPLCSGAVTDRCVQRGGRDAAPAAAPVQRAEAAPPVEEKRSASLAEAGTYPPCSGNVTDRCVQTRGSSAAATQMARAPSKPRSDAKRMRLAMLAGERG